MTTRLTILALLSTLWACGDGTLTPDQLLEKSCRGGDGSGEVVPNCRPGEYAIVREASVSPAEVEVGDPLAMIDVRFVIDGCPDAPQTHAVGLTAIDETGGRDGGTSGSMTTLDTFRDGSARDDDPTVGVFEGSIPNFFLPGLVRERNELVLVFEPRIDVCRGGSVEVPYRTGPTYEAGP